MKEDIYNNYYEKILFYSLSKTRTKEDALDLVNDIFVAVFSYIDKTIKVEKLDNLIWKIASNCWKKQLTKYNKDKRNIYDDLVLENLSAYDNNIDKIIYEEIINNINEFDLTDNEKLCFLSFYENDLSIKEISSVYKIRENNIKYYLYNSRKKIKEKYNDQRKY